MAQFAKELPADLRGQKTTASPIESVETAEWTTPVHLSGSSIGYDEKEDMFGVRTTQKKFRDSFSGATLDTNKWDVIQTGAGQVISQAAGALSITTGVTANAETILLSKEHFTVPFRGMFGLMLSQRIINQEFYLELVSVDESTGLPDEQFAAGWLFDAATVTQAKYQVQSGGLPRLSSAAVTIATTASYSIKEIECFTDETWFHDRAMDSIAGRSASWVRHQQIPDPNRLYKIRLRAKNLATAPLSTTTFSLQYITVVDYSELTTEITASRGAAAAGMALPVQVANALTASVAGSIAHDAATANNPTTIGARANNAAVPTQVSATGDVTNLYATMNGALVVREHCIPEQSWSFACTTPIINTTDLVAKVAGGAGIRNYVNGFQYQNTGATATEIVIKDGAVVLWRGYASAGMGVLANIQFDQPLRGSAATALNIACVTTGASVYVNVQGYQSH